MTITPWTELRFLKEFDPVTEMPCVTGQVPDRAALLAHIEEDARYIAADCGYDRWTINTGPGTRPAAYFLTLHYPDGSHQTDVFTVLDDRTEHADDSATVEYAGTTVIVTRSAGTDGAVVVFIDTDYEPDASDGGPGLRVLLNDDGDIYEGVAYAHDDTED